MLKLHLSDLCALLTFAAVLVLGSVAEVSAGPDRGFIETGKKQFVQYCSSCHGIDARGNGPAAKALSKLPVDLTVLAKNNQGVFPTADVAEKIDGRSEVMAHGSREMPVWGRQFGAAIGGGSLGEELVRGNIHVLIEYLKSIQR